MPIDRWRFLQAITILGALGAYTTIVLGGTVRGMGAGLACPDWPLCRGSIVPDLADPAIAVEYAHRLAAAVTSLCLLIALVAIMVWFRPDRRLVTWSVMSFSILVAQVAFGAFTIASALNWVIVTIHLALGTATFASAIVLAFATIWAPAADRGRALSEG